MSRNDRAHTRRRQLGRRIRAHRMALDLTIRDICHHIHTGKAQIHAVEGANTDVLTGTLIDVAAAVGLEVALAADHHLPLLDLTADEIRAITTNLAGWLELGDDPLLRTALTKLTATVDGDDLDADTYPADYDLQLCQPADTTRPATDQPNT